MAGKPRIFTVEEANALLPRLNVLLQRQAERYREIEASVEWMRGRGVQPDLKPRPGETDEVTALKAKLRDLITAFRMDWDEVESLGGVVKDVKVGLVDFRGEREGKPVWLCWKYGEPAVSFWHPIDKGFDARRPLEVFAIPRTLN